MSVWFPCMAMQGDAANIVVSNKRFNRMGIIVVVVFIPGALVILSVTYSAADSPVQ